MLRFIAVDARRSVVDCHYRPGSGRGAALTLSPICIAQCCKVLMNHCLTRTRCARGRIVPIVAHSEHLGIGERR